MNYPELLKRAIRNNGKISYIYNNSPQSYRRWMQFGRNIAYECLQSEPVSQCSIKLQLQVSDGGVSKNVEK